MDEELSRLHEAGYAHSAIIRETNRSAGTTPRLTESLKNRPPFFLKKGPLSEVFRLESCDASVDSR
jgi:hypothetical protein